jgi:hypothetical protein
VVGKKVVDFYKQRGIPVTSPLDKAIEVITAQQPHQG